VVEIVVVALLVALLAGVAAAWLPGILRRELSALRDGTAGELAAIRAETAAHDRQLGAITETLDRRLNSIDSKVDRRFEHASETTRQIHEQLGRIGRTNEQMLERAKDLSRLQEALRPPKARGGFGEHLLANLLADTFPRDKYELQYGFRSGERVDAVIRLDRSLVPVDAKFPLDNFQRLVEADADAQRELFAKQFARDVKGHVDAIAQKYIRPDEGTYEFALMYVPAEAVYYELVCGRVGGVASPLAYALERRVIPVSPSTLHAYLLVLVLGFKGMQIEEHAREVMAYVAQLGRDFARFRDDFDVVGKHLGNAQSRYADAGRRLEKLEVRLERAAESPADPGELPEQPQELPLALDAA
jgi:DNA recombination protein RmuC